MDFLSFSGKKGGSTYSAGSGRTSYSIAVDHVIGVSASYLKAKEDPSFQLY
jgi:hypothetical protein